MPLQKKIMIRKGKWKTKEGELTRNQWWRGRFTRIENRFSHVERWENISSREDNANEQGDVDSNKDRIPIRPLLEEIPGHEANVKRDHTPIPA